MKVSKSPCFFMFLVGTQMEHFPKGNQLQHIPCSGNGFQTECFHQLIIFLICNTKYRDSYKIKNALDNVDLMIRM